MPSIRKKYLRYVEVTFVVLIVIIGACMLHPGLTNIFGISTMLERRIQRQNVLQRIQTAGGWDALQKDCIALTRTNQDREFHWTRWMDTTNLPPALAALQPWEVRFYPSTVRNTSDPKPYVPLVHIKVFGMHSTGGLGRPYYGLEVLTGPGTEIHEPQLKPAAHGNSHYRYRKITDHIYEIY